MPLQSVGKTIHISQVSIQAGASLLGVWGVLHPQNFLKNGKFTKKRKIVTSGNSCGC